jgi:hypothetical protein
MRKVDKHAETVHFLEEVTAGRAKSVPVWFGDLGDESWISLESGIRILVMAVPGQGRIFYAQLMVET